MKSFCILICLTSLNSLCHSAPQFNNFNLDEVCKEFEVKGGSSQTNGIYKLYDDFVWKKPSEDRFIFNKGDSNGWKIGTEGQSLYGASYYFKSGKQNLPWNYVGETWTSNSNGEVTVSCHFEACPNCNVGGVSGRRGCLGQLSLYQGETLLEQIEAVGVPMDRTQISSHETKNNFRIDSVEVTGDCCWEIESNDGDYEIVFEDLGFPQPDISVFLSQLSPEYYVYAKNDCF